MTDKGWRVVYKPMHESNVPRSGHYERGSRLPLSFCLLKGLGDESFLCFFMKHPRVRSSQIAEHTDSHYFRCFVAISGYSSCSSFGETPAVRSDNNFPEALISLRTIRRTLTILDSLNLKFP